MVFLELCALPTEGIRHKEIQTNAYVENQNLGMGVLYVAEESLMWIGNDGRGFSLNYPSISLHAISKDTTSFPSECIYLMAETDLTDAPSENFRGACTAVAEKLSRCNIQPEHTNGSSNNDDMNGHGEVVSDDGEGSESNGKKITEIRFVPVDKGSLEPIFQSMSDCQALHPDENESFSDDEGVGDDIGDMFAPLNQDNSEVQFDEHGQVVYRHPAQMRGVVGDMNIENENANGETGEDDQMETGQFDDA